MSSGDRKVRRKNKHKKALKGVVVVGVVTEIVEEEEEKGEGGGEEMTQLFCIAMTRGTNVRVRTYSTYLYMQPVRAMQK